MAEQLPTSEKKSGANNKRLHKKSMKVDLTPMVDLGFLLITFFVFTTTMSMTTAMEPVSPKDTGGNHDLVCESCVITVLPTADNKIFYSEGKPENAKYGTTDYSAAGLRKLLADKKKRAEGNRRDAILIIKPGDGSSFKNLIDVIDESTICLYKRYYLDKITADETDHISAVK